MSPGESEGKEEALFIQLVMMFQIAAMQQMGKVQNPITQKVERNLEQAGFSIDMLEMIQAKTKDSLSETEKKFLEHALFELRMNYLDETNKDKQEKEKKPSGPKPGEREPSPGDAEQDEKKQGGKNPNDQATPDKSEPG
jgi:hypothetical protein